MLGGHALKSALLLLPIIGMLLVGTWLSLRSGLVALRAPGRPAGGLRLAFENFSRLVLALVAVGGLLLAIEHVVGLRVPWLLRIVSG